MTFELPRDVIVPVDAVRVRLEPGPHPFESDNRAAIDANWLAEIEANPALFDGTVVLLSHLACSQGVLEGRCHAIRFASFLYWRRVRPAPNAEHAFAHAMLVSSDGALIAIRMGAHTANPGRVYFAAGSFEPADFVDGLADVDANMIREVREETGLDLTAAARGRRYHVLSTERGTVIVRRYDVPLAAEDIATRIRGFVARDPDPEIDGPVVIRAADDLPDGLMPHMPALIAWHFGGGNGAAESRGGPFRR